MVLRIFVLYIPETLAFIIVIIIIAVFAWKITNITAIICYVSMKRIKYNTIVEALRYNPAARTVCTYLFAALQINRSSCHFVRIGISYFHNS